MNIRQILLCGQALIITLVISVITVNSQSPDDLRRANEFWKQGVEHYQAKRYDAAITSFNEYIKIRPDDAGGWFNRGISYYERGVKVERESDYRQAVTDLSQAIKLDPKYVEQWLMRGRAYQKLIVIDAKTNSPAAIADFTEALRLDPKLAEAFGGRGKVYYDIGQYDKALVDLNAAIRLNPTDAASYYYRGKIYGYQRRYAASRSDIEKAISIFPNYEVAKIYLDYITSEEKKAQNTTATKTPVKPSVNTSTKGRIATAPKIPSTVSAAAGAIKDARAGFVQAEEAEKARDHKRVIDVVTRTLPVIKMSSAEITADDLDTHIFLNLIRMRARANMELKNYAQADADYEKAATAAMKNINHHNSKANVEMNKDKTGLGAGMITGELEYSYSTIICDYSFKSISEWIAAIDRDRPQQMNISLRSAILMGATRQICAITYVTRGNFKRSKISLQTSKTPSKDLEDAVSDYTKAIEYMQVFRDAYVMRAKAYRELGKPDLAAADERKAATLPVK